MTWLLQGTMAGASVGMGCGTCCGSGISAFLFGYLTTHTQGLRQSVRAFLSFYLGKVMAVTALCLAASLLGIQILDERGALFGVNVHLATKIVMGVMALWMIIVWIRERNRKGCTSCGHCSEPRPAGRHLEQGTKASALMLWTMGSLYGISPCAPLILMLGYAVTMPAYAAGSIVFCPGSGEHAGIRMRGDDMKGENAYAFPFHYGQEAESYTFYRVPKILFTAEAFDHLSTDAKLLYGILLDRMQLSVKNSWIDADGKVFIYYPRQCICDALTCASKKAGQLLAELDERHGIGLITRIHQGLGKPDKIYVHKCIVPEMKVRVGPGPEEDGAALDAGRGVETTRPEVLKGHAWRCRNDTSGGVETTRQEVSKGSCNDTEGNKTEINDTEMSETDLILSDPEDDAAHEGDHPYADEGSDGKDAIEEYYAYRDYFEQECSLEDIRRENPYHTDMVDEILEILTDTCCSRRPVIRIGGEDKPAQIVKSRFMKLDGEHIRYVLKCFLENTTKVRNIKQYLLAALYNAPMTIGSYYTALVNHDMYGTD